MKYRTEEERRSRVDIECNILVLNLVQVLNLFVPTGAGLVSVRSWL